jgi:acyl carrier protein phosphodiesterase
LNFLAHCLIAEQAARAQQGCIDDTSVQMLVTGGFLGDFLKGPVPQDLPPALAQGVRLHRRIDAYSNGNEAIRRSCNRCPRSLRRLAPPLVDIIADHLLANQWQQHHHLPLVQFTAQTYQQIDAHAGYLPDRGLEFLQWMRQHDLLASYRSWEATCRGMRSVTRRLRRPDLNPEIEAELPELLDELAQDFDDYFPDLLQHAAHWLSAEPQNS